VKGIRLDEAERMSFRTVKAEPKNATYLDTYAWVLFKQKRYDEAQKYIDQTLENDSVPSAEVLEHAGDIYYHVGEKERAVEFWQKALDTAFEEKSKEQDGRQQVLTRKIKLKKYVKE
jgi:Tfp pilus assembly protein PilF